MQYIKLFENWLNEEKTEEIESYPFDPKTPSYTLILQTSQKDLDGGNNKVTSNTILDILKRFDVKQDKYDAVDKSQLVTSTYTLEEMGDTGKIALKDNTNKIKYITLPAVSSMKGVIQSIISGLGIDASDIGDSNNAPLVIEVTNSADKTIYIMVNRNGLNKSDDFATNTKLVAIYGGNIYFPTLGQIGNFVASGYQDEGILKKEDSGNPLAVAKILNVPENYAKKFIQATGK